MFTESKKNNILVTGFGLFGDHKINPSWCVAEEIKKQGLGDDSQFNLIVHQLPVEYLYVQQAIPKLWKQYEPWLVVHLGVHSLAHEVILETKAHNSEYSRLDVCGCVPEEGCCALEAPRSLKTALDLLTVTNKLKNPDIQLKLSNDPGRYLCDFTYFCSLMVDRKRVVFIHVPCLDSPYSLEQLTHMVKAIILELLKQILPLQPGALQ